MASNVDLAIVKAQLSEYRKALQIATAERDNLKSQLAQHSTDSARQSQEQARELGKLTQRLADLNNTISALESNSDSTAKMYQELLDKADKDHRAEVSALERSRDFWRVAAIVSAAAAVGLGIYAAVK